MPKRLTNTRILTGSIYHNAENAVIGKLLERTTNSYEQARLKLVFDYIFYFLLAMIPLLLWIFVSANDVNLILFPFFITVFLVCLFLLKKGVAVSTVGAITALNTLIIPMVSSFFNNMDTSPKYTVIWILSVLLCYLSANRLTTLAMGCILCLYLSAVAYMQINPIPIYVTTGYPPAFQYITTPIVMAIYLLFLARVLGRYYHNLIQLEQKKTIEKQKLHLSLVNQNLIKQFLLVKGFSSSGKSAFMKGDTELIEACFLEIEKQCESAINYLTENHSEHSPVEQPGNQ
jgi:hypothetical protein